MYYLLTIVVIFWLLYIIYRKTEKTLTNRECILYVAIPVFLWVLSTLETFINQ